MTSRSRNNEPGGGWDHGREIERLSPSPTAVTEPETAAARALLASWDSTTRDRSECNAMVLAIETEARTTALVHIYAGENLALCGAEVGDPCATCTNMHRLRLSSREMDVLVALSDGATAKEAAEALGLSYQTVKNHLTAVYHKLDVNGLVAAYAVLGWLTMEDVHARVGR